MTTGMRYVLKEALGWGFLAIFAVFAVTHYQEIKAITADILGLPQMPLVQDAEHKVASTNNTALPVIAAEHTIEPSFGEVRIQRGRGGHYRANASINKRSIDVLVDTGATLVSMTYEDARRAGIFVAPKDFNIRSRTANGIARSASVNIRSLTIGDITLRNVRGTVSQPGALHVTLLGMSFLGRLSRVEMRKGELILQE